jgi:hypothetical protein
MLTFIKRFLQWLDLFSGDRQPLSHPETVSPVKPDVRFYTIQTVEKTPKNDEVVEGQFIVVVHKENPYWTVFRCPCGCQDVISLAMQAPHQPRWYLDVGRENRPSLHPSIWRSTGCMSHFWVRDGYVNWCPDSGREPWKVRPDLYRTR